MPAQLDNWTGLAGDLWELEFSLVAAAGAPFAPAGELRWGLVSRGGQLVLSRTSADSGVTVAAGAVSVRLGTADTLGLQAGEYRQALVELYPSGDRRTLAQGVVWVGRPVF